jgi:predicted transcriptional regulator
MKFETIKRKLINTNCKQLAEISTSCGIPLPTLIKIKYGASLNPRVRTVERLAKHFETNA